MSNSRAAMLLQITLSACGIEDTLERCRDAMCRLGELSDTASRRRYLTARYDMGPARAEAMVKDLDAVIAQAT